MSIVLLNTTKKNQLGLREMMFESFDERQRKKNRVMGLGIVIL